MTSTMAEPVPASPRSESKLSCKGVVVRFGGLVAVNDVDLVVAPGAITGLIGPNGAGKSTLFAVMSGLLAPSAGQVFMEGADVTRFTPQARSVRGLARTFQHPELFVGMSVRDHLVLAYRARHQRRRTWTDVFTGGSLRPGLPSEKPKIDELIELLGLAPVADRQALGLPLGYARLVELGRALASEPQVLLLDEPSSGLDSNETNQFEDTLLRVVREQSTSILLVEHDVELVMRICQQVYVLDFGTLIASGPPEQVRSDPAVRAAYLGEEIVNAATEPKLEMDLRAVQEGVSANGRTTAAALEVRNLEVRYGEAAALDRISFKLEPGESVAVLGANGAGKSSLARAVSGLVRPSAGQILLGGEDISSWSPHRIRRAGLIHLPEGRGVFRSLSVLDNVKMAATGLHDRSARQAAVDLALETFPVLGERQRQTAGSLSGGEQQMLSLARALATRPKLIVADEMSLGLAPLMVDLVFEGLDRARKAGVTVVMIEQYVHRALAFADHCLLLQRGTVAWQGKASEAGEDLLGHYLGSAAVET